MENASDELDAGAFGSPITSPDQTQGGSVVSVPGVVEAVEEENYDTSHPKRGIALVFNHVKFASKDPREGSNKDRDNIEEELKRIGFEVRVFNNLKKEELLSQLKQASKEDHKQNDCFLVVVMTHGNVGTLSAFDKDYTVAELWEPFTGEGSPTLIGKPKLFFLQACRGEKLDKGVKMTTTANDTVDAHSSSCQKQFVIPSMADVLVMYSTYEGHYSWRNRIHGSWFIQSLCSELKQNAHRKELIQLLTAVSRRVAYHYQSNVPDDKFMDANKQMPCVVSMLTRALFFPPK